MCGLFTFCYFVFILFIQVTCLRRNVLLIVIDDLRPALGCYGDRQALTPHIDKFSSQSFTFHRSYAQQALCAPSRNSFLTSRRPDTLHLYDFYNYWRNFTGNFTTLPQYFKENNYNTVSIGKIFHPGTSSNYTDDYPLSWTYEPWHPPTEIYKDAKVCLQNGGWYSNIVCPVTVEEMPGQSLPDIQSLEKAKHFLQTQTNNSKPFFLAVGFHKPHIPLKFPRKYLEYHPLSNISMPSLPSYPPGLPVVSWNPWTDLRRRHDIKNLNLTFPFEAIPDEWIKLIRQSYYASVTYIDELIGHLLNELDSVGHKHDTVVALIGDHGWSLGEHGLWSKYSNFEAAVRVPFILRVPGLTFHRNSNHGINLNLHSKELVELVDLLPTLVDVCGLEKVPTCPVESHNFSLCSEGVSLVPLIAATINQPVANQNTSDSTKLYGNNGYGLKWKKAAFSQYPRPSVVPSLHPNSDKPKLKQITIMGYSMRTKWHRYTEWVKWNFHTFTPDWTHVIALELYDHVIDPDENLNLAGRSGLEKLQAELSTQLRNGWRKALPSVS